MMSVASVIPPKHPAQWAAALMQSRQTILPKRLGLPGPDAEQLQALLGAAACAPDHGQLLPWRFILIPDAARQRLADVFAQALLERDAAATEDQVAQAREKAFRSPVLMLVVVDGSKGDPDIDLNERVLSAGCAVQNILLMATAQGFGSALTSGKAVHSDPLRQLFGLSDHDRAICFISVGTVIHAKTARARPVPADYVSSLAAG